MILLTPEEAAEEFPVSARTIRYWAEHGRIQAFPREDNARPQSGGHPGYRVARHEVAARVRRMPPPERRGGRRSPSRETPTPPPEPHPTSHPHRAVD